MAMTPDDFKIPLIEEAWRLRRSAIAQGATHRLDERTTFWVIRDVAWREFMMTADFCTYVQRSAAGKRRNELIGLPVRVTIDDEPDIPMIQLVMEPMIFRPRP